MLQEKHESGSALQQLHCTYTYINNEKLSYRSVGGKFACLCDYLITECNETGRRVMSCFVIAS